MPALLAAMDFLEIQSQTLVFKLAPTGISAFSLQLLAAPVTFPAPTVLE